MRRFQVRDLAEQLPDALSSSGRTPAFEAEDGGSNPPGAALPNGADLHWSRGVEIRRDVAFRQPRERSAARSLGHPPGYAGGLPVTAAQRPALGAVAQLDEHLPCKEKDAGSSPVCSTRRRPLLGWGAVSWSRSPTGRRHDTQNVGSVGSNPTVTTSDTSRSQGAARPILLDPPGGGWA